MTYILEISDLQGDGFDNDENLCCIESESPLPIPSVGDRVLVRDTYGVVKSRELMLSYGQDKEPCLHYQVFCEITPKGST